MSKRYVSSSGGVCQLFFLRNIIALLSKTMRILTGCETTRKALDKRLNSWYDNIVSKTTVTRFPCGP